MPFKKAEVTVSAAVVSGGTIAVSYPTGTDAGHFYGAYAHSMWVAAHQKMYSAPANFTVAFGTSSITVTYNGSTTIPANTRVSFQFDALGPDDAKIATLLRTTKRTSVLTPVVIQLGAPDVADADGICASQSGTAATAMTINGALATSGVATFDQPRNVVAAWTGTAVLTVTGTDEYGNTLVESSASGTSLAGKKAFKTITSVVPSANITSATVGSGDVLGLPVALPEKALAFHESEDGTIATAGTLVAAVRTTATATTGDVRGTYDPNSACDGSKVFQLLALVPDLNDRGVSQYAG
jgi:hypothetical protein